MKFTSAELEILRVLFDRKSGSTRDVYDVISKERRVSQGSINTLMSAMFKKGILDVVEDRRPAEYAPKVGVRAKYDVQLKAAATKLFGSKKSAIMRILFGKPTTTEAEKVNKLLDEME